MHERKAKNTIENNLVYIIFPCYNEEEGLEKLLFRIQRLIKLKKWDYRLVIINDGSQDHTRHVVESFIDEMPIHFIDFEKNRGVADVFNVGFKYVLETSKHPEDVVITIDSDNTMNPYVILNLIEEISDNDIVIASRFVKGGKMVGAGYRGVLSYIASYLMRWKCGLTGVTDYSIFFRAYQVGLIQKLMERFDDQPLEGKGFSCMANLLLRVPEVCSEPRFKEVPLVLRYDQKKSPSSINIIQTTIGYLNLAFRRE